MAVLGTFILCFGWFGFNPGSTLAATDHRFVIVALNTMLASASGAMCATLYAKLKFGKPDPTWMCNGMLAGLVAITAPCAFVSPTIALLIGAVSGFLVIAAALFVETTLKIDDPVGAIAVHGCNGIWGILALGLFANGTYGEGFNGVPGTVKGLFYGDSGQLVASLIGIGANVAYVGTMAGVSFLVIGKLLGNRVDPEIELAGLDVPEMGVDGYIGDPGIALPDEAHNGSPSAGGTPRPKATSDSRQTEKNNPIHTRQPTAARSTQPGGRHYLERSLREPGRLEPGRRRVRSDRGRERQRDSERDYAHRSDGAVRSAAQ
jgi:Amt family ammonium transporter